MKAFFRFLIGISTGYYWSSLHNFLNGCVYDIKTFLHYFSSLQFTPQGMSFEDLIGLSNFAGIFLPRVTTETNEGSIRFSVASTENGGIVGGRNYSERGLLVRSSGRFNFIRTDSKEYLTDISTEATNTEQASFIPKGASIIGYLWEGDDFINEDGFVDESKLHDSPATDRAYTPFYGNKYLRFNYNFLKEVFVDSDSFFNYFTVIQSIWYNGESIESLITLTKTLCEDFIKIVSIVFDGTFYKLSYKLNFDTSLVEPITRQALWLLVIQEQFLRIVPQEV